MKNHAVRYARRIVPASAALILSGCLMFLGPSEAPEYVEDTLVVIRTAEDGSRDYVAAIGETETTVFEVVLSAGGDWFLGYRFIGTDPLNARELTVYTVSMISDFAPETPWRGKDPDGLSMEIDEIPVPRYLISGMAESEETTIHLAGDNGDVVLVPGDSSRRRLEEILALDAP